MQNPFKTLKQWIFPASALFLVFFLMQCKYYTEDELFPPVTDCDTTNVTYTTMIYGIFETYCFECHGTSVAEGGVVLDTYDGAIISAQDGRLWQAVSHAPGYPSWMPKDRPQLSDCHLAKIRIWISAGLPE